MTAASSPRGAAQSSSPAQAIRDQFESRGAESDLTPLIDVAFLIPTRVLYRFADGRTTSSLDDVAAYIRRMRAAMATLSGIELRREITAAHKVPHKFVVAVLNRFAAQGVRDVDFFGTQIPGKRTLDAESLPYPAGDR